MIPIPISPPQIVAMLLLAAAIFFIAFFFPTILELKKPRDAGPRMIFESDGKEIVGFSFLFAVYFRENSRNALSLDDIESQEFEAPRKGFLSIPLLDIEV